MSQHSTTIPAISPAAYEAARRRAAMLDRSNRGRIVLSGSDRASYLQGLLTNDIVALAPGQGCYAAYLTPQGRMIADAWVYEIGDVMLVVVDLDVKNTVLARFDQFLFSEDVQLGDVTDTFAQLGIVGPQAASALALAMPDVPAETLRALPEHGNLRIALASGSVIVTHMTDAGEPGFDLYAERSTIDAIKASLHAADVEEIDAATADAIRIEAGVPRFHRDMDEETIPLEAGIEARAISFTKGCYVGQEVIIRVLHRGHGRVARRLIGMRLDGAAVPASGAAIRSGDREIGHVTSATYSPALAAPIALGYVHRDFVEPGTKVTIGETPAQVSALPFVPLG